ncbi:hypothetical protein GGI09_001889 [Coemansia sp. S100]|nr:hypothetical protein GGH13_001289 [Coemansia sp. S155-1]KAJ2101194.1 hypothetical protein GGI09_001889 [Coemansia sp. S100]
MLIKFKMWTGSSSTTEENDPIAIEVDVDAPVFTLYKNVAEKLGFGNTNAIRFIAERFTLEDTDQLNVYKIDDNFVVSVMSETLPPYST